MQQTILVYNLFQYSGVRSGQFINRNRASIEWIKEIVFLTSCYFLCHLRQTVFCDRLMYSECPLSVMIHHGNTIVELLAFRNVSPRCSCWWGHSTKILRSKKLSILGQFFWRAAPFFEFRIRNCIFHEQFISRDDTFGVVEIDMITL
ncbi:hypothetical protein D3C75_956320 [compost metagenome]